MTSLAWGEGMLIEQALYTNAEKGLPWEDLFNSRGKYVSHYTTLDTALRHILGTGQLRLSPYASTNDPRESKDWEFTWLTDLPSRLPESHWAKLGDRANALGKRLCRVLCTTQDSMSQRDTKSHWGRGYCHPRMWDQYAGRHSGVCLVFDKTVLGASIAHELRSLGRLFSAEVRYGDRTRHDLQAFRLNCSQIEKEGLEIIMRRQIKKFWRTYFFQKALDWKQEQEYRWVLLGDTNAPEFYYVDMWPSLKYIILGVDCAEVYFPALTFICEEREIPIGRLVWRSGQPFFTGSVSSTLLNGIQRTRC